MNYTRKIPISLFILIGLLNLALFFIQDETFYKQAVVIAAATPAPPVVNTPPDISTWILLALGLVVLLYKRLQRRKQRQRA